MKKDFPNKPFQPSKFSNSTACTAAPLKPIKKKAGESTTTSTNSAPNSSNTSKSSTSLLTLKSVWLRFHYLRTNLETLRWSTTKPALFSTTQKKTSRPSGSTRSCQRYSLSNMITTWKCFCKTEQRRSTATKDDYSERTKPGTFSPFFCNSSAQFLQLVTNSCLLPI